MGSDIRYSDIFADIDTNVILSAYVSHFWDIGCSVAAMVAPYLVSPPNDVAVPSENCSKPPVQVADYDVAAPMCPEHFARLSMPLTSVLTMELDGAQLSLDLDADEILLAALGRAIARVIGDGALPVDVAEPGRSATSAVSLACTTVQQASATATLRDVHRTLTAVRRHKFEHGFVHRVHPPSEVCFTYLGRVSEPDMPSALSHPLELRVHRTAGVMHLDWWYDSRRFLANTVEELAEQFPLALVELTSEAVAPIAQG
jgi:hypothetical protein